MKTVLLAYERDQDLAAIETLLQSRGHRVAKARNGLEALEVARSDKPHVIVSDVLLPRMDGFALCRRIKEDPVLQHLPVLLLSFRVEGPKYEAFAAEVGAERFFPRGSTLEELATAIEEHNPGSGTMRMPALVPELLERREQDRRRLVDLEKHLRELEATNAQLTAAERVARDAVEREARSRADRAAADSNRIRELLARVSELEARQQKMSQAESQARGVVEESRAELARVGVLETRLAELQQSRARAQAAAIDAERVFAAQPVPVWVSDMETHEVRVVSDAAAALLGIPREQLVGRSLADLLPGYEPGDEPSRPVDVPFARPDGTQAILELRRQSVSFAGRACWLTAGHDVTAERAERATREAFALRATALDDAPLGACLVDGSGELQYANTAFLRLIGLEPAQVSGASLRQFERDDDADSTIRRAAMARGGPVAHETRWRRPDGSLVDVEISSASVGGIPAGMRVVTVRDISTRRRITERAERDQRRIAGLLDLAQRAHSLAESEIHANALELLRELTGSECAYVFLTLQDGTQLDLVARHDGAAASRDLSVLTRWRGTPPAATALHECLSSQRPVARDAPEGTGSLQQAGLPGSMGRQLATPILDGARLVGVLLLANKPRSYDDEDQRHATDVADAFWKILRRRRSDAEVVSAMDHMERVMLGAIEALALLGETQDASRAGRASRVADLSASIGTAIGLPGHSVRGLRVIAQLIDVGMLQIPREILWRPGPLSAPEIELVKTHVERGHECLKRIEFPWPVAEAVRQHHERLDGSGYPRGLQGEEIMLEARIVAVADAVDAMLSPRPQRPAMSVAACLEELQAQAGRRYDARVVKACVKLLRERETRTEGESAPGQRIA
jgi:PAS domain S-box-containing protein